jgi:hypothetical protein
VRERLLKGAAPKGDVHGRSILPDGTANGAALFRPMTVVSLSVRFYFFRSGHTAQHSGAVMNSNAVGA